MRVGIPCMKCSLNPSQQVNKNTGKKSKTCGINSAWKEMNDERLGRDPTIDKSMTDKNVWMVGNTQDDVIKIVEKEIKRINQERREAGKRVLRSDCVSVVAIVEKPNIDYMQNLSYEERKNFLNNSHEVMKELISEWNPNWKIIEAVQHHDEFNGLSAHNHSLVMLSTIDKDGIPNMRAKNELNLKFFNHINTNYSVLMRSRGFEVEDVKTFDRLSQEEKEERKLNPKQHGIDAYTYKKRQEQKLNKSIEQKIEEEKQLTSVLEKKVVEITNAPNLKAYEHVVAENTNLKEEIKEKDTLIERLKREVQSLTKKLEEWKTKFTGLSKKIGTRLLNVLGFKTEELSSNYLPEKQLIDEINIIQNKTVSIDPKNYRVIPDKDNPNKFSIVYKDSNNQYKVFENNFSSRSSAKSRIQELAKLHQELMPKIKINLQNTLKK